ncbi:MAG: putative glycoside hydrolase [Bacteroidota bacterium]
MFKTAKVYVIFVSFSLIFLLSTGGQQVKSEQPLGSDHPTSMGNPLEFDSKHDQTILKMNSDLWNQSDLLKHLDPFLNLLGDEAPIVKGVYATGWMTGRTDFIEKMLDFTSKTEVNSMVIDVKDDSGRISYRSKVALAQATGASYPKFDPVKVTKLLRQNNVYPIARIVVFKDPYLAGKRPDLAVKSVQGGIWRDFKGLAWVDPYNRDVWDYNVAVAKEAAGFGFKEIQFDYVRFTSDGVLKNCHYSFSNGRSKSDTIADFLKYAYQELKPLGVKVSADVFGLTCSAQRDMGIGQVFEKIAENVDIICPMVYPSHYTRGDFNIPDPDRNPYQTVYRSMMDAKVKAATLKKPVIIRPWLQDFSLRNRYGRDQLLAQIKAVQDAGLQEWIFWNPTNRYDIRKYRLKQEVEKKLDLSPNLFDPLPEKLLPTQNRRIQSLDGRK